MKPALAALLVLALFPAAASAGPCEESLAAVDRALAERAVPPDQQAQVKDMRDQAANLCSAGNEQEGIDVLAEARAMLGIE